MEYDHGWNTIVFVGVILALVGPCVVLAVIQDNWKIRWGVWYRWERIAVVLGVIAFFVGVALITSGCGEKRVKTPVNRETVAALYIHLSILRFEVAECAARREPVRDDDIFAAANQDAHRLREEFDAYVVGGPYCGPVCNEILEFIVAADRAGFLSCE